MKMKSILLGLVVGLACAAEAVTNAPYVARWPGNRAAAVSFTFDDGLRDQYELAFPKLKELGIKGTFFLNGGSIESQKPTRQGAPRMTWAMVKEMADAGMEMSNHGLYHLNHGRSPREAVAVDVASNDVLIATHTGKRPITFAYPNNARNREWSAAVVNPGRVGARTRQTSFGGKHTVESGRKLFQKAKADGAWLVLMTHAVRFGYDQWRDPAFFYTLLEEAAKDDELWIGTFAEVSIYERLREETRIEVKKEVEKRGGGGEWKVKVTPPKLDRELFKGKLDLVLPDGRIHSFDPFAGDFTVETFAAMPKKGVVYRGIFVNDEDWSLRPWAIRHFGKEEQIGVRAYAEIFQLMKADGLNLIWPAMHEGGYEFSSRPENLALAKEWAITIGTSHCEPMLRNNCYLSKADKAKWSWVNNRDFVTNYWAEGVRRGLGQDILWTLGMRGIHDGRMPDGKTVEEKKAILEDVFAAQLNLLSEIKQSNNLNNQTISRLFCPYKEVLPIYNAGLKVPEGTTIMWVNDNFGFIRRLGGPQCEGYPQGLYWHLSYHGRPHSYIHLCTTPPAFMWYELVAKAWQNGVRNVWMVNAGDVFQAELLLDSYGRLAADPEAWGADAQEKLLSQFLSEKVRVKSEELRSRIVAHLNEYYALGFNRKPEHMCIQWTTNLSTTVKTDLLGRYHALLAEDLSIESEINQSNHQAIQELYFRLIGFQAQFLAHAGIIHLEGRDREYARSVLDPLYERWNRLEGGKWAGFWCDTIDENGGARQPTEFNRWSSQMQWPWNEPPDPARKDRKGVSRNDYVATAYRADVDEPQWLEPAAVGVGSASGSWQIVKGLGTSGRARALLPVKPGVGVGATLSYNLPDKRLSPPQTSSSSLVLQFLPDFALWPGLKLGVNVRFDAGDAQYVAVPKSDSNLSEHDRVRQVAVQDNFIRVTVPIPRGTKTVAIEAVDPGVVIDRVGVRGPGVFL